MSQEAILTPPPMTESRVKSEYLQHDKVRAAMGCKIDASDIDMLSQGVRYLL